MKYRQKIAKETIETTEKGGGVLAERKRLIKQRVEQGKPVPREVLEEYKSEKWAQEALKKEKVVKAPVERDILGGEDPIPLINKALREAKAVRPKTEM